VSQEIYIDFNKKQEKNKKKLAKHRVDQMGILAYNKNSKCRLTIIGEFRLTLAIERSIPWGYRKEAK